MAYAMKVKGRYGEAGVREFELTPEETYHGVESKRDAATVGEADEQVRPSWRWAGCRWSW